MLSVRFEILYHMVFITIKITVHATRYLAICCDKMMMINNQSWVNVHAHLVDGFKCISILLDFKRPIDGGTTNNLTNVILNFCTVYGGLTTKKISNKLMMLFYSSMSIMIICKRTVFACLLFMFIK
jgi:hypothetical protein